MLRFNTNEPSPLNSNIKTVFLYDKSEAQRARVLNYFTMKGGYRILCLDFLVQTKKMADEIMPDVILCCPNDGYIELLKTILVLKRGIVKNLIPIYIYGAYLTERQKAVYFEYGVRNFFDEDCTMDDIYLGLKSGASYIKSVAKSEIIQEEGHFVSGAIFYKIKIVAAGIIDLNILLSKLSEVKFNIEWSDVVLDLGEAGELGEDSIGMIIAYFEGARAEAIDINMVDAPESFQKFVKTPGLKHFNSFQEFLEKAHGTGQINLNINTYDLDSLPNAEAVDKVPDIDDLENLDDLLNLIPE